jgi:hypothetical protein
MSPELASIIVALIGLLGIAIKEFRSMKKTNSRDHGAVMQKIGEVTQGLKDIHHDVEKVADRLDSHIEWHLKD